MRNVPTCVYVYVSRLLILGGLHGLLLSKYRLLNVHNDRLHSKVVRPMMSCHYKWDSFVFSLTILYIEALARSM